MGLDKIGIMVQIIDMLRGESKTYREFRRFFDPGHSWLQVPTRLLVKLGILSQISPYSYQKHSWHYLEEDCDMGVFIDAMKAKGIEFKTVGVHLDRGNGLEGKFTHFDDLFNSRQLSEYEWAL